MNGFLFCVAIYGTSGGGVLDGYAPDFAPVSPLATARLDSHETGNVRYAAATQALRSRAILGLGFAAEDKVKFAQILNSGPANYILRFRLTLHVKEKGLANPPTHTTH